MIRALAGHNVSRYPEILKWPVAEALNSYEEMLREDAQRQYDLQFIAWAIFAQAGSKAKDPTLPPILKR